MTNFIDRWIDRLEGSVWNKVPREESVQHIVASIRIALREKTNGKLLFAGTATFEEIQRISKEVEAAFSDGYITCVCGKNVVSDAETVLISKDCLGVVLVEERNCSTYPIIEQEIITFQDMEKEILGFVLVQE